MRTGKKMAETDISEPDEPAGQWELQWIDRSDVEELPEASPSPPTSFTSSGNFLHFLKSKSSSSIELPESKSSPPSSSSSAPGNILQHLPTNFSKRKSTSSAELADLNPSPPSSSSSGNFLHHATNLIKPKSSPRVNDKDFELLFASCTDSESRAKPLESSPPQGGAAIAGRFLPKPANSYSSSPTKLCEAEAKTPQVQHPKIIDEKTMMRIPASAISYRSRCILSMHMNPPKLSGNDWKGLADLLGFSMLEIQNFALSEDPMGKVMIQWTAKRDSTFGALIEMIKNLFREDVMTDLEKPLGKYEILFDFGLGFQEIFTFFYLKKKKKKG